MVMALESNWSRLGITGSPRMFVLSKSTHLGPPCGPMDRRSSMTKKVEFGLDTFGDVTVDAAGTRISQAQVIRNVVEEGVLADRLGIDNFGVGEHHRDDFAISAPEVVLAA